MELFKKILCPIDFSEFSTRSLRYAIAFAQQYHCRLVVQHCIPRIPPAVYNEKVISSLPTWTNEVERQLRKFLTPFESYNLQIETRVEDGNPASRILHAVAESDVDLVVMGTHGLTGYQAILMGSVTNKVLHKARIPVLTVCRPTKTILSGDPQEPLLIGRILCAIEPGAIRVPLLSRAMAVARLNRATIVFFSAVETSEQKASLDDIRELIQPEKETLCKVEYAESSGYPVEEILKAIQEYKADLVIMGHHSRIPMALEALGSVTLRVIPQSSCPVLVLRD